MNVKSNVVNILRYPRYVIEISVLDNGEHKASCKFPECSSYIIFERQTVAEAWADCHDAQKH